MMDVIFKVVRHVLSYFKHTMTLVIRTNDGIRRLSCECHDVFLKIVPKGKLHTAFSGRCHLITPTWYIKWCSKVECIRTISYALKSAARRETTADKENETLQG
jgi:hypothetical protein